MPPYAYALIGISLIFVCTTLGSLVVFFLRGKTISARLNKIFVGFAAGVMFSAAFFSLLKPAIEANVTYMPTWAIAAISILLGAGFLWLLDKVIPHFHNSENKDEGIQSNRLSKTSKMFLR